MLRWVQRLVQKLPQTICNSPLSNFDPIAKVPKALRKAWKDRPPFPYFPIRLSTNAKRSTCKFEVVWKRAEPCDRATDGHIYRPKAHGTTSLDFLNQDSESQSRAETVNASLTSVSGRSVW